MGKTPDRLYIARTDRDLYEKLNSEEMFKFKDKGGTRTRREQFLFAMAIGFRNSVRIPLETREGFFLTKDLHPEDEALLNAVALAETNSCDVLLNRQEVFQIAEELAHAGIRLLVDKISGTSFGTFEKKLEKELRDLSNRAKAD